MEPILKPYVGPRPFGLADEKIFYGREREAKDLRSLVIANSVLLFYAPPGAGKSSLLNAKLIPSMKKEGMDVILPTARVSGRVPRDLDLGWIRNANIYILNTIIGWNDRDENPVTLARQTLAQFLQERPRRVDEEGASLPRLLIFDQFEELFDAYPERWQERKGFFQQIAEAVEEDRSLRVLFSLREDYIAKLDPYVHLLPENLSARYRMQRLPAESALSAIEKPLRKTKLRFAPGVAEQLVRNLLAFPVKPRVGPSENEGEFVEPIQLQITCEMLWKELKDVPEKLITKNDLKDYFRANRILFSNSVMQDAGEHVPNWTGSTLNSGEQRERVAREESAISRLTYLLLGGGIGAIVALLFAPKSGQELRGDVAEATHKRIDRSREAAQQLSDRAGEYYEATRERASELYTQAAGKVSEVAQTARDAASRQSGTLTAAIDAGKKAYQEEKRKTELSGRIEAASSYEEKAN